MDGLSRNVNPTSSSRGSEPDNPMTKSPTKMTTGCCPKCGQHVSYEPCELLPRIVPLCDACEAKQSATWQRNERETAWRKLYRRRLPDGYHGARRDKMPAAFLPALRWQAALHPGGIGLIGISGAGKSHAIACILWQLQRPFIWWSGTEARDAAIEAATADKDREGARRRWEEAMVCPILVLDDISQGRMTEAWSSKLFDALETRMSSGLPTFWTSQIPLSSIRAKIVRQNGGDDAQADAISRRLGQHSEIFTCVEK